MKLISEIQSELRALASDSIERPASFFKTSAGAYAEFDAFLGVSVPKLRHIAKKYAALSLEQLQLLIDSPFNEERLLALIILVQQYRGADSTLKAILYQFYIDNIKQVNNWNLVDSSAHYIVGAHLFDNDKTVLKNLAHSASFWERRIAMVATWYFIKQNQLDDTFEIAKILLHDKHDLIHKAVGWMLREAGKRNIEALIHFLDEYAALMPRTMLRYAIEKFEPSQRQYYLMKRPHVL